LHFRVAVDQRGGGAAVGGATLEEIEHALAPNLGYDPGEAAAAE